MLGYASVCRDSCTDVQVLINAPADIANQVSFWSRQCMQSLPGRPLIEVSMEKVKELTELGLTWTKIADILHISRQTLYRRLDG